MVKFEPVQHPHEFGLDPEEASLAVHGYQAKLGYTEILPTILPDPAVATPTDTAYRLFYEHYSDRDAPLLSPSGERRTIWLPNLVDEVNVAQETKGAIETALEGLDDSPLRNVAGYVRKRRYAAETAIRHLSDLG